MRSHWCVNTNENTFFEHDTVLDLGGDICWRERPGTATEQVMIVDARTDGCSTPKAKRSPGILLQTFEVDLLGCSVPKAMQFSIVPTTPPPQYCNMRCWPLWSRSQRSPTILYAGLGHLRNLLGSPFVSRAVYHGRRMALG